MKFAFVFLVCLAATTDAATTEFYTTGGACGYSDFYGPSGVISSPNHPFNYYDNLYCFYYIYANSESSMSLHFRSFNTETYLDVVTISCPGNTSFPSQEYSGHYLPSPVSIPWCSLGSVQFRTDGSIVYSGFSLDYFVSDGGCGETLYNESSGYVTSPNYPSNYGYYQNCSNIIWAPQKSTFFLQFWQFSLESDCSDDWLEIRCLDNAGYGPYTYCGYISYTELYLNGCNELLLWFHSDGADNYPGFNIQYNIYPEEEGNSTYAPPITTEAVDQLCGNSYYYDSHGVILSPNYPGFYYNYLYCDYYVYAPPGSSLSFIFNSFHVENADFATISCPPNSNFPPQEYSGHYLPEPVSIQACSQGRVNFRTDYANASSGFSIDYYISDAGCGNTVNVGSYGFVSSPFFPDTYGYNQNCSNIIWAAQQSTIHLQFRTFILEDDCSRDWLEISCLDNPEFVPTRYCGTNKPSELFIYRCSQVLLFFHSDDSGNYPGFNIEYTIYQDGACGQTSYYDPSGVISSPNHPDNYLNFLYCDYTIYAPAGSSLTLIFTAFNVEENYDFVSVACASNSSYPTYNFTGVYLPSPMSFSECSQGLVNLRTDYTVVSSGFSLDYNINVGGCGNTLYYPEFGNVTSPNWPSKYGYNQNCSNIIHAWSQSTFYLRVHSFVLQSCCSCDWLEISCLDNSDYGPTRYCGSYAPTDTYIYNCSQVLLWFHSDDSSNDQGFNIGYNVFANAGDSNTHRNGKSSAKEKAPSNGKLTAAEYLLKNGKHNADKNLLSNRKSNSKEDAYNDEKVNETENVPRNGKLSSEQKTPTNNSGDSKVPRNGKPNVEENATSNEKPNAAESAPNDEQLNAKDSVHSNGNSNEKESAPMNKVSTAEESAPSNERPNAEESENQDAAKTQSKM